MNGDGEALILFNDADEVVDQMEFDAQSDDIAFARVPNGTGNFIFQNATHKGSNDVVGIRDLQEVSTLFVYPNPTESFLTIKIDNKESNDVYILNAIGQIILNTNIENSQIINVSNWDTGVYFVKTNGEVKKFMLK